MYEKQTQQENEMLELKSDGVIGNYLYRSTFASKENFHIGFTDMCEITRLFVVSLLRDFAIFGLGIWGFAGVILVGLDFFYADVIYGLFTGILIVLGLLFIFIAFTFAVVLAAVLVMVGASKASNKTGITAFVSETARGWKDKYCPTVRIIP